MSQEINIERPVPYVFDQLCLTTLPAAVGAIGIARAPESPSPGRLFVLVCAALLVLLAMLRGVMVLLRVLLARKIKHWPHHHAWAPWRYVVLLAPILLYFFGLPHGLQSAADEPAGPQALWKKLEPFTKPPDEFAGKFGPYASPLKLADGSIAKTPADWAKRRAEILKTWHERLGPWPKLVEKPMIKRLETVERDGYTEQRVQVQALPNGQWVDGYLLIPKGKGPFPAVVVPFYDPLTSIGQHPKKRGAGTHDYGLQLVKRGFIALCIGTPGSLDKLGGDTREALIQLGKDQGRQPLTMLAYVAANCLAALAQLPEVDPARIGIIGLSYGGKWAMFASCLEQRFACAAWSDPGIVFNEKDANVNYWEPWYLGFDPKMQRKPGVPSEANPRTGLYKKLIDSGQDLVDLHALMAPRPVLVSGGVQDPPRNWIALNHLVAVNEVLGKKGRVAMTARTTHIPTAAALDLELDFLEYFLKR